MPRPFLPTLLLLSATALAGCGITTKAADANPRPHDAPQGGGLFSGESGNLLDAFKPGNGGLLSGGVDGLTGGAGIAGNVHLWRAALNVTSILPLAQTDSAGGVIISEWANVPNTSPQEQVKLNITITGNALAPESLNANVFKRQQGASDWIALPNDAAAARKLEDAILTKARVLSLQK